MASVVAKVQARRPAKLNVGHHGVSPVKWATTRKVKATYSKATKAGKRNRKYLAGRIKELRGYNAKGPAVKAPV